MNKRDFIKKSFLGIAGIGVSATSINANLLSSKEIIGLPNLKEAIAETNSLFSNKALSEHYEQHFITSNHILNKQLNQLFIKPKNLQEIILNPSQFNPSIVENASAYYNHRMFFKLISSQDGNTLKSSIHREIVKEFGSLNNLVVMFTEQASKIESNGWLWLVVENNKLKILATQNNKNPLQVSSTSGHKNSPVLCIDMWDHAYKPNYGNNVKSYLKSVINNTNWSIAERRYKNALKFNLT